MNLESITMLACPKCGSYEIEEEQFVPVNPRHFSLPVVRGVDHDPACDCHVCGTSFDRRDALEVTLYPVDPKKEDLARDLHCQMTDLMGVLNSEEDIDDLQKMINTLFEIFPDIKKENE